MLARLYVCHGDDGGPKFHPCRRVQEALRSAGKPYDKVIAAYGSPIPFLRKGSRERLRQETGTTKLPAIKLPEGTVLVHDEILAWIDENADSIRHAAPSAETPKTQNWITGPS